MSGKNGKHLEVNINDINLDLENPRVPLSIRKKDQGKTHKEINEDILQYLIKTGSITELMLSIGENGFFAGEAILLIPDENNKDKFIVVEGNRRVTALKLLHDPSLANISKSRINDASNLRKIELEELELIPAIRFEERSDILKYLGYRHITGIKNWKALEKARYMNDLYLDIIKNNPKEDEEIFQEIAKSIGSKRSYVKRILEAFKIYNYIEKEDFFDIGINDEKFHFVNLSDSLNKSNIKKFLIENDYKEDFNKENIKSWTEWLFKENTEGVTRLNGSSDNLTKLDAVISNPLAMESFAIKKLSLEQASTMAEDIETILADSLEEALYSLYEADRVLSKIENFSKVYDFDDRIKEIRKLSAKIHKYKLDQEIEFDDEF